METFELKMTQVASLIPTCETVEIHFQLILEMLFYIILRRHTKQHSKNKLNLTLSLANLFKYKHSAMKNFQSQRLHQRQYNQSLAGHVYS